MATSFVRNIAAGLRSLLQRDRAGRELEEELRGFMEMATEESVRKGISQKEASRQVRLERGSVDAARELVRSSGWESRLEAIWRDLRYSLRALRRAPGFTAIAVLTLALGIGATTAVFGIVDAVLLRPLPFPHPEQLIAVREQNARFTDLSVAYPNYLDWAAQNKSFAALSVYHGAGGLLTHAGTPVDLYGQIASASYFDVLGVKPELGRTFLPAEDDRGASDVIVLSDSLWRERFGASPQLLGRTIEFSARPYTVVGVMPPGFPGILPAKDAPKFWVPIGPELARDPDLLHRDRHSGFNGLGRLRPGVTLEMARADLNRIARSLARAYPKTNTGAGVAMQTYMQRIVGDTSTTLWILLAAVGLVLLIACANVANLVLTRANGQQRMLAIRTALGATRAQLLGERMIECFCLGCGGAGLGLGLAWAAMRLVADAMPDAGLTRGDQLALDWRVLAFAAGAALVTTLLFGLGPAWHASAKRFGDVLKQSGRDAASGHAAGRLRAALVATEMALAVILLVGAGLLIRSMLRLEQVDPGFDSHHLLTFEIDLPTAKYPQPEQRQAYMRQALDRLGTIPGVTAVGGIYPLPFGGNDWEAPFTIVGRPAPRPGSEPSTNFANVQGDFIRALGMHLLRGRGFDASDRAGSTPVAIVDESFARQYWAGPDPLAAALGQQIMAHRITWTIVGVVRRVMDFDLDPAAAVAAGTSEAAMPETFVPMSQSGADGYSVITLRMAQADPLAIASAARTQIDTGDPDQPIDDLQTMDQRIAGSLDGRRMMLNLMAGFAALALILAAIGIYGVISYSVTQRTHEIGVRMALGARSQSVLGLVLGQGMRLAAVGAFAGLLAAMALGRLAAAFLYSVKSTDPVTLAAVPLLLFGVAGLACYLPARRATRVDPLIALRGD